MSLIQQGKSEFSIEKMTRVILIFAIIGTTGALVYVTTRPVESDILFFVLNQDQALRDYPTNATVGENFTIYAYIENILGFAAEFAVRIYWSDTNLTVIPETGVWGDPLAHYWGNYTKLLQNNEFWTTAPISLFFSTAGPNHMIFLELWQYYGGEWHYCSDYLLFLRLEIFD